MMSGAQQGRLLHTLVRLGQATRVLEIGCFTGYATLWMALGLRENGQLLSLERDERCAEVARRHLDASGVGEQVEIQIGDALESLRSIDAQDADPFDLVFIDADKKRCGQYFDLLVDRGLLAEHTLILVDNVIWKGHVLDRLYADAADDSVLDALKGPERLSQLIRDSLHDFSLSLAADPRGRQFMLPLRDGLTWAQVGAESWDDVQGVCTPKGATIASSDGTQVSDGVGVDLSADPRLPPYLELVGSAEPTCLAGLRREAEEAWPACSPGSAVRCKGACCHTRPPRAGDRVLEIGCFTGYATLWMALGLRENGQLLSLERDERCAEVARRHLDASGVGEQVEILIGDDGLHSIQHASTTLSSGTAASGPTRRSRLVGHLAAHGVLVIVQPPEKVFDGGEQLHAALAAHTMADNGALKTVSIPAPDGSGGIISFVSPSSTD